MTVDRNDMHAIADEYVLGLLEAAEAADVEAEMEHDADLRQAVAASRERFLPLDTSIDPAPVDEGLWQRISAALPEQTRLAARPSPPPASPPPANDNRIKAWRATAIAAIAASILLVGGLTASLMRTVEPVVIAVLLDETGQVQAVVEDFGNENATVQLLADISVPADRTMQVWTLPSKDTGPVSLGLIEGTRSTRLDGPALPRPKDNQLYEITLEQRGGSPTGRPTGPILAKGFAQLPR
ncbi:anti-sigma factor domain-containing protein [Rhizobium sp. NRK18]|uniref:anti-sigma factor n=1 Tax=Rhizobium sp. NRK18 TaxID=2964667 RepID=UPI0021C2866B|nr:anti-sigma factor [Rhizobium sp. NRK18]MCQ2005851.1 anti-sigma factor [Rhizobium sp. NRK18]